MKALSVLIVCLLALGIIFTGCTTTQKGAVVGGATGAAIGGVIGHQSGHGAEGAGIGAAVGAISGAIIGEKMANKFCPVCGASYTSDVQYCPKDGAELKSKQK